MEPVDALILIHARLRQADIPELFKLSEDVRLPERARIDAVVAGVEETARFHVGSPHLADTERADDFAKEVAEEPEAGTRR